MSDVISWLNKIGFYKLDHDLSKLYEQAVVMVNRAGTETELPRFEAFPSLIPLEPALVKHPMVLTIDIGGTSTKAGIRRIDADGNENWTILFEIKNSELRRGDDTEHSFLAFSRSLGHQIRESVGSHYKDLEKGIPCGVVWSNALRNELHNGGVTGIVVQREQYQKGEWFVESIENETDLGAFIKEAFQEERICINHLMVSNDTPLTLKAMPGAHSGMVASTGLNATIIKSGRELGLSESDTELVCNGEMGGRFFISPDQLSDADRSALTEDQRTVECVSAGRFLPIILSAHILLLAEHGVAEFIPIAKDIQDGKEDFRPHDMSLLLSDPAEFLTRRSHKETYSPACVEALTILVSELVKRSAKLCAVVALASVSNQFPKRTSLTVALDSRLAREMPLFWNTMEATLRELSPADVSVKLVLISRLKVDGGKISVPMQGVANALDSFQ